MGRGLTEGEWAEIIRWEGRVKNVKRCGRRRLWAVGIVASNTPIAFFSFAAERSAHARITIISFLSVCADLGKSLFLFRSKSYRLPFAFLSIL